MIRMSTMALAASALMLSACGQAAEKGASSTTPAAATTVAAVSASNWPHSAALCDLIATRFAAVLQANAERHPYPSGDTCKVGGSPPGQARAPQVRVLASSRTDMTPALLGSFRAADHTVTETPDLGESAFMDVFAADTQQAKVNFVTAKNGHLVTIEVEFGRPIADADVQTAHALARDFVAAM